METTPLKTALELGNTWNPGTPGIREHLELGNTWNPGDRGPQRPRCDGWLFSQFEAALSVQETQALSNYPARDPDVRLMLAVRDDDAAAFEELVLRYQNRLVSVLEHLVGHREQAEDLAQDVFLRVYRSRKRYEPTAKFSTWLFTIANNVALNARRSLSRRKEVNLGVESSTESGLQPLAQMTSVSSGQLPARQLDKAEMRDIVQLAVGSLNERQRLAVLLNKFEEMSYADIAEVMDLSPKAVKSLLSRARENLRQIIEPYLDRGQRPSDKASLEGNVPADELARTQAGSQT